MIMKEQPIAKGRGENYSPVQKFYSIQKNEMKCCTIAKHDVSILLPYLCVCRGTVHETIAKKLQCAATRVTLDSNCGQGGTFLSGFFHCS